MQDLSYQFIEHALTQFVAAGTQDAILKFNFDLWSRSKAFMDAIAHRMASNPKFLEPALIRELGLRGRCS